MSIGEWSLQALLLSWGAVLIASFHLSSGSCTCLRLEGCAGPHTPQLRCSKRTDIWTFVSIRAR